MKPGCWSERSWRSLVYKKELQWAVNSLINIHPPHGHTHRLKTHPGLLAVLDDSIEITFLLSTHWVFVPLTTFYTLMLWKGNLGFWESWINWCTIFIFYILNKCISLNILLCLYASDKSRKKERNESAVRREKTIGSGTERGWVHYTL